MLYVFKPRGRSYLERFDNGLSSGMSDQVLRNGSTLIASNVNHITFCYGHPADTATYQDLVDSQEVSCM